MIQLPIDVPASATGRYLCDVAPAVAPRDKRNDVDISFDDSMQTGSGNDWSPSNFLPDRLMDYAVRMVMPMLREFGRAMDVTHFLYNGPYAREIITLALTSRDARLRAYAIFLNMQMFGAVGPD